MVNPATIVFGPLAGPECRRSVARGWLILVRALAATAILGVTAIVLWYWWMRRHGNPYYMPFEALRFGLIVVEVMVLTIALVMAPAVMAGSLAGERERGALGLLLTTRVSSREIVAGRLAGKLAQVVMILMAAAPAVVLLAALAGFVPTVLATLLALPLAVAAGGGGLSAALSAVSRRGRDALLTVYLIDLFFLLGPLTRSLGLPAGVFAWLSALNPYSSLDELIWSEDASVAAVSMALWLAVGLIGVIVASVRLAPVCLAQLDGARVGRAARRRGRIPLVDERPMLWKEHSIERARTLGGVGWWLGALLVVLLGGGSLVLLLIIDWDIARHTETPWADWARGALAIGVGRSSLSVSWLIQWAVGLRAAVAIATERERGTWDAILTSPLEGGEIVRAKVWGCLYALRWLFAAALFAWTVAATSQAMSVAHYASLVIDTLVVGTFMAAVGVRTSLAAQTATRAIAVTIGVWLGARVAVWFVAGILYFAVLLLCLMWTALTHSGTITGIGPGTNLVLTVAWPALNASIYALATLLILADTRLRFDRIAGRMAGGKVATAVDRMIHGGPIRRMPRVEPDPTTAPRQPHVVDK